MEAAVKTRMPDNDVDELQVEGFVFELLEDTNLQPVRLGTGYCSCNCKNDFDEFGIV